MGNKTPKEIKDTIMQDLFTDYNKDHCVLDKILQDDGYFKQQYNHLKYPSSGFFWKCKTALNDILKEQPILFFRKYNYEKLLNAYITSIYGKCDSLTGIFTQEENKQIIKEEYNKKLESRIISSIEQYHWSGKRGKRTTSYHTFDDQNKEIIFRIDGKKYFLIYDEDQIKSYPLTDRTGRNIEDKINKTHPQISHNYIIHHSTNSPTKLNIEHIIDHLNAERKNTQSKRNKSKSPSGLEDILLTQLDKLHWTRYVKYEWIIHSTTYNGQHIELKIQPTIPPFIFKKCALYSDGSQCKCYDNNLIKLARLLTQRYIEQEKTREKYEQKLEDLYIKHKISTSDYREMSKNLIHLDCLVNIQKYRGFLEWKLAAHQKSATELQNQILKKEKPRNIVQDSYDTLCTLGIMPEKILDDIKSSLKLNDAPKRKPYNKYYWELKQEPSTYSDAPQIGPQDFLIKTSVFRCKKVKHHLKDILVDIYMIDREGQLIKHEFPAGYCPECGVFFVLDSVYKNFDKYGFPLCQIYDSGDFGSVIFPVEEEMHMSDESILMQYGYNVSQKAKLSAEQRQKILANLIDNQLMTKSEIISYLDFFINVKKGRNQYHQAISKWEVDKEFVENYRVGEYTKYGVNALYRR